MGQFDGLKGTKREKKNQVKKTRSGGSSGRSGSDGVQVLTGSGVPADMLPCSVDDVGRLLPLWVSEWCEVHAVQDMRKASPLIFGAMCADIGQYIKHSRILKDNTRSAVGACPSATCNRYDAGRVVALYAIYERLCGEFDKIPFQEIFAAFCGVGQSYIKEFRQDLTSSGLDIAKNTKTSEMLAIRRAASRDPVGRLAILNNEYWGGGSSGDSSGGSSVASLPADGGFALLSDRSTLD